MGLSILDVKRFSQELHQEPEIVTIAAGASVSSQIDIRDRVLLGVAVLLQAAAWTTADIGIQVSMNGGTGGTWTTLYSGGAPVRITNVTATRLLHVFPTEAWAVMRYNFIRLVSLNTSTYAAVTQVQARTLEVSILG